MFKKKSTIDSLLVLMLALHAATVAAQEAAPAAQPAAAPSAVEAPAAVSTTAQPVPVGTEVVVKTVDALSSTTATTGQKFAIEVAADVVVDGRVLIPQGSRGTGTVLFARKKGASGAPGALDVRIDSVDTPSGPVRLKSSEANRGTDRRRGGTAATLMFGVFGALAVQGDDIALAAGSEIHTIVAAPRPTPAAKAVPATQSAAAETAVDASTPPVAPAAPAASSETSKEHH